jgi:hypothetical protein
MNELPATELTFDSPALYEIRVCGHIEASWSERLEGMSFRLVSDQDRPEVTVLQGELLDQAALAGVLATLYDMQMPVLSVTCLRTIHPGAEA